MSKIAEIFNYFRQCPQLNDLWSIGATEDVGIKVIFPNGSSQPFQYSESLNVNGEYECDISVTPSVYEDYQINCYTYYDTSDNSAPEYNINVLNFDEVQSICDWVKEQNENKNFPEITGKNVVSVECLPFIPQIRYVNQEENTVAYFITVRIRYVNPFKQGYVEYGC